MEDNVITDSFRDELPEDCYMGEGDHHDDTTPNTSGELFHPSIANFPKKMTELLLLGKKPVPTKSVDEFMTEIPLGSKKKRRTGRRRLNELTDEQRQLMGEINMCFVRKDFDRAWNLCEELIKKGKIYILSSMVSMSRSGILYFYLKNKKIVTYSKYI